MFRLQQQVEVALPSTKASVYVVSYHHTRCQQTGIRHCDTAVRWFGDIYTTQQTKKNKDGYVRITCARYHLLDHNHTINTATVLTVHTR